jgi:hypothetical protein
MNTLTKKEVEDLLNSYDADPVDSLRIAVSSLLGVDCPTWDSMTALMPTNYTASGALGRQEMTAMDELVKQLVEHRAL